MHYVSRNEIPAADGTTARRVALVDSALAQPPQIRRCPVAVTAGGDAELVAAVDGKSIRVLSMFLLAETAVTLRLYSGSSATGTALTGPLALDDHEGLVLPAAADPAAGWFQAAEGAALKLNLSTASNVGGCVVYCEV
jgi:hypothetical protein